MGLVRFALRLPHLIIVLIAAIVIIGVVVLFRTPTDILPVFKTPAVQILTLYPGMPAESLSQANLTLGTAITLEVLQALDALTNARTRLVEAIVEYNKSQTRLLNALGELSVDTLISAVTQ